MKISEIITSWRSSWAHQQRKHELGPDDDVAWHVYVNSLTPAEMLDMLVLYDVEENP